MDYKYKDENIYCVKEFDSKMPRWDKNFILKPHF